MKNFIKFNDIGGTGAVMQGMKKMGRQGQQGQQPAKPEPEQNGFRQRSLPLPK